MELDELEGAGITDRAAQMKALGLSLAHLDRIRRAAREESGYRRGAQPRTRSTSGRRAIQLGVRVPVLLLERLRRYSRRMGVSVALVTALALDDWLDDRGWPGPRGTDKGLGRALGL
jgi:hypothetical protein